MPPKKTGRKSTKPDGWLAAGISVPIELTVAQAEYSRKAVNISRFVYNLAAATHRFHRRNRLPWPATGDLRKAFNACKREDFPWVLEVSKWVATGAFNDFDHALKRWRNKTLRSGPPQFKKKKRTGAGGFLADAGAESIKYDGNRRIKLAMLGSVRMSRRLPPGLIPYQAHIKYKNGRWHLSLACWKAPVAPPRRENQAAGGVDVGLTPLAVDSDGNRWENPQPYAANLKKLRRWQRALSRRTPGSRGWRKAQRRLDRLHRRITGLRDNRHHHLSKELVFRYNRLGIESLNVKGMIRAGLQSKALTDAAMGGLLSKIRYKAQWYGTEIAEADQWYPSSKTCSNCGVVNPDLGRETHWTCPSCNSRHDRNFNAAKNLKNLAMGLVEASTPVEREALAIAKSDGETTPDEAGTAPAKPRQLAFAL